MILVVLEGARSKGRFEALLALMGDLRPLMGDRSAGQDGEDQQHPPALARRLTGAERAEVVAKYQGGTDMRAIAQELRVHRTTVAQVLQAAGVPARQRGLSPTQAAEAVPPRVRWRLSIHVRMRLMAAPRKYPEELRERAVRLAVDARRDPVTRAGALRRVGEQLGINPETLRNWVTQAEIDQGHRPGTTTDDATRLAELERENRELRRANAILKSASAFFAAELDRPQR
jgi:transposase